MSVDSGDRVHVRTSAGWFVGVVTDVAGDVISASVPVVPAAPGQPTRQTLTGLPYDASGVTIPSWRLPQPIGA